MVRNSLVRLIGLALVAALSGLIAGCDRDDNYVVVVHGYESSESANLRDDFYAALDFFRVKQWKKKFYVFTYYKDDEIFQDSHLQVGWMDLNDPKDEPGHCAHSKHYASGHVSGKGCDGTKAHTTGTDIRHLGYHLAWQIYDEFTSKGHTVEIMAHSMGGLIVRYALQKVQSGHPDFPPSLKVDEVMTFGTPHGGVAVANLGCFLGIGCPKQVDQMKPGSSFLDGLWDNAPRGSQIGSPTWTTYGSEADTTVGQGSSKDLGFATTVVYEIWEWVAHSDYFTQDVDDDQDYTCWLDGDKFNGCRSPMGSAEYRMGMD